MKRKLGLDITIAAEPKYKCTKCGHITKNPFWLRIDECGSRKLCPLCLIQWLDKSVPTMEVV